MKGTLVTLIAKRITRRNTMKRTPLIPVFILVVFLAASCTSSGPCNGSLTLENPIPDTTVAVGDTLFVDLTDPPVFASSKGRISYSFGVLSGVSNVDLNRMANPNDEGDFTIFLVIGETEGEATAELRATSGCLENSTTFNITIIQ